METQRTIQDVDAECAGIMAVQRQDQGATRKLQEKYEAVLDRLAVLEILIQNDSVRIADIEGRLN